MKKITGIFLTLVMAFSLTIPSIHAKQAKDLSDNDSEKSIQNKVKQTINTLEKKENKNETIITFAEPNGDSTKININKETGNVSINSEAFDSETAKALTKEINNARPDRQNEINKPITTFNPSGIPESYTFRTTTFGSIDIGDTYAVSAVVGAITGYLGGGIGSGILYSVATKVITDKLPTIYTAEHIYTNNKLGTSYKHVFFFDGPNREHAKTLNEDGAIFFYDSLIFV